MLQNSLMLAYVITLSCLILVATFMVYRITMTCVIFTGAADPGLCDHHAVRSVCQWPDMLCHTAEEETTNCKSLCDLSLECTYQSLWQADTTSMMICIKCIKKLVNTLFEVKKQFNGLLCFQLNA